MALVYLYQSRGMSKDIQIQDAAGNVIMPSASDKIRATIGRLGETAKLIVSSDTPSANGSTFTKGALNRLVLKAADLAAIEPGTYTLSIDFYCNVDAAWKNVDRQVAFVEKT